MSHAALWWRRTFVEVVRVGIFSHASMICNDTQEAARQHGVAGIDEATSIGIEAMTREVACIVCHVLKNARWE
eukprot:1121474-Amphidinium_carterae.1